MFFKHDKHGVLKALPSTASTDDIMTADAATLRISNQKNGHAGACVHHEALHEHGAICSVRALGRRVIHIQSNTKSGNVFLSSYWDAVGRADVTDGNVSFAVKFAARKLNYPSYGIPIERVDTHSLRSGGACALKQAGYNDMDIQKMGRWAPNSTSFMEYIQQQLSSFSAGMAAAMSAVPMFTNMEGTVTREDLRPATIFAAV